MLNSDKITKICINYNITPNQFYYLYLVYKKDWKNLHEYVDAKEGIDRTELEDLVSKGYLEDVFNRGKFEILDLLVTPNFTSMIFIDSFEAGEELYKTYPNFIKVQGQQVVSKKGHELNGKYWGKDQLIEEYSKRIGNDIVKHKNILERIENAKKENVINFTIRDFILNELWDSLEDIEGSTDRFNYI